MQWQHIITITKLLQSTRKTSNIINDSESSSTGDKQERDSESLQEEK